VVTTENPRKLVGDFPTSPHLVWRPFLGHCGRVSVRGSRSILQGFQRVGSNFLPLGTPILNAGQPGLRSVAFFIGADYHLLTRNRRRSRITAHSIVGAGASSVGPTGTVQSTTPPSTRAMAYRPWMCTSAQEARGTPSPPGTTGAADKHAVTGGEPSIRKRAAGFRLWMACQHSLTRLSSSSTAPPCRLADGVTQ
jgi:hypothetical protein